MDNKEQKSKSWLDEDIEGAEELHQAHARIFGDGSHTVSMPLEEYRRKVKEFEEISDKWHQKHQQ